MTDESGPSAVAAINYGPSGGGLPDGPIRPITSAVSEHERKRPVEDLCGGGRHLHKVMAGYVSSDPAIISHAVNHQTSVRKVSVAEIGSRIRMVIARDEPTSVRAAAVNFGREAEERAFRENALSMQSLSGRRLPSRDPIYAWSKMQEAEAACPCTVRLPMRRRHVPSAVRHRSAGRCCRSPRIG